MHRYLSKNSAKAHQLRRGTVLAMAAALLMGLSACDPERKKQCEWYLMPNTSKKARVDEGFISVCARNLIANKEDCRLQTTLSFAKKVYGKTFRYVDLKVKSFGIPRTIQEMTFCTAKEQPRRK